MRAEGDRVVRHMRIPILGLLFVIAYGIVGYALFGNGLADAVHRTAMVLTTVGFTAADPPSTGERLFTASVAVLGVGTYLAILGAFGIALAEGRIGHTARRRRMQRRIDDLKDHFVICAYGRVGRAAARELEGEGIPFVVVDRLEELEERMRSDGVLHILDDPTSEGGLRHAGIERARALISAVDSDADNVYITLTARSLNPRLFIVARASEPRTPDRLNRAGADRVISPYVSSGRHMALLAVRPRVLDYLEIVGRDERTLRLEELAVDAGSHLVGRRVAAVCGDAKPLVIRRAAGDVVPAPTGEETLEAGDLLVLLGEPTELRVAEGGTAR